MSIKLKHLTFKSLSSQILEKMYFQGILLSVTFGIGVLGCCCKAKLEKIERIHQRAYHIIIKVAKGEGKQLARSVKWKLISYAYKKTLLCLSHKAYYKNCPEQFEKIIEKCDNATHNMRDNAKLRVNRPNTELGRTAFRHRSATGWNCLPETLKRIKNYEKFKEQLGFSSSVIEQISFNNAAFICNKDLDDFKYF